LNPLEYAIKKFLKALLGGCGSKTSEVFKTSEANRLTRVYEKQSSLTGETDEYSGEL